MGRRLSKGVFRVKEKDGPPALSFTIAPRRSIITIPMSNPYSIFDKAERKRSLSRFLEAIPLYLEARRLSGIDDELKSACYFSLGDTYRMVGEFTRAGKCYAESRKLLLALGDEERALDAMVGLALSLRATGEVKESRNTQQGAQGL
ncbi:MAG: tetratricopeptide repeat protein [Deltaproteobacteria bacterium]|nr:tetratricopeptide repeat protein [Deltaproteobacteria bacterium]